MKRGSLADKLGRYVNFCKDSFFPFCVDSILERSVVKVKKQGQEKPHNTTPGFDS